jgi:hypothetical protein
MLILLAVAAGRGMGSPLMLRFSEGFPSSDSFQKEEGGVRITVSPANAIERDRRNAPFRQAK